MTVTYKDAFELREHSTGRLVATASDIDAARYAARFLEAEAGVQGYRLDVWHNPDPQEVDR